MSSFNAEAKVWTGAPSPYLFDGKGIGEAIWEFIEDNPDHIMQIGDNDSETYLAERLKTAAITLSENLLLTGIKPGNVIALFLKNHPIDAVMLTACAFIGATICVLPHDLDVAAYQKIISDIMPKMILITEKSQAKVILSSSIISKASSDVYMLDNVLPICFELRDLLERKVQAAEEFQIFKTKNPENNVAIITVPHSPDGKQVKLIQISDKILLRSVKPFELVSNTVACPSDLSSQAEVIRVLRSLFTPVTRIFTGNFNPGFFLSSITKYDVDEIVLDTTNSNTKLLLDYLEKKDLIVRPLEKVLISGKELNLMTLEVLEKHFPDSRFEFEYTINEIGGRVTFKSHPNVKINSLGKLDSFLCAKIVDIGGQSLGPNDLSIGELFIGCNFKLLGYVNNAVLNRKKYTEDGYFRSGMYGYFDADGELHLAETIRKSPSKDSK